MIYTFDARGFLLYPVMKSSFELSDEDVYKAIQDGFEVLQKQLKSKKISYDLLKGALISNQDKYREAVIEGYLVDHDAPHRYDTKLSTEGIHYTPGQTVTIYDPVTGEITNSEMLEDELNFDVEQFNRQVITRPFNETVLEEIARYIDPSAPRESGKTLIFAVDDGHPKWKYGLKHIMDECLEDATNAQAIVATHDPLVINGVPKEFIRIFTYNDTVRQTTGFYITRVIEPTEDITGMGIDGLLQSEYYGLYTTLDVKTQERLEEKPEVKAFRAREDVQISKNARFTIYR